MEPSGDWYCEKKKQGGIEEMAKVAIMGFGTVGGGVAEVLRRNAGVIAQRMGEEVSVKYILDVRDFDQSPYAGLMIKDFSIIENDPEVEVVAEAIGGAKIALEFTRRALLAGKHVVTSIRRHNFD